jgi:hypothetical protein
MLLHQPDQDVRSSAEALAQCALSVLKRRFPHKLDHLILDADDHLLPQEMHPVFDGCFDWHSSVHMHWALLRLRTLVPGLTARDAIAERFDTHCRPDLVERELAYVSTPGRASFERPYGWAWLLKLQAELETQGAAPGEGSDAARWAAALRPLADDIARRLKAFVRQSHYPVRAGTHANSTFAMLLARDYAKAVGDHALLETIDTTARGWFGADRAYPANYEPSGTDFLSAGLCEALLMQRVLGADFAAWWKGFVPPPAAFARWDSPAVVSDRLDGQLVHLDGLNLSRAWCLRALACADETAATPAFDADLRRRMTHAARAHWHAAWPHVIGGDFVATHWLVSFALLR